MHISRQAVKILALIWQSSSLHFMHMLSQYIELHVVDRGLSRQKIF